VSAAHRQVTCACCGRPFTEEDKINVEPLIDGAVRYVAVHWGETTHPTRKVARR
jgi:hypothetical protein